MMSTRRFSAFVLSTALLSGLSCTLILTPRDEVDRCGTADDCPSTGDNRYEPVCRADPDANIDTTQVDQICVAELRAISCKPENYPPDGAFATAVSARSGSELFACADTPGVRGCPPGSDGSCTDGLVANKEGFCDTDAQTTDPAVFLNASQYSDLEAPQAVLDQFCKSFFCEDNFVCDTTEERFRCVPCDPSLPFGQGGCGTVYTQGSPSCTYVRGEALTSACAGPMADLNSPLFGDCG